MNDLADLEVEQYPTIFVFNSGDKLSRVDISEHTKTMRGFIDQVKKATGVEIQQSAGDESYESAVKDLKNLLRKNPQHITVAAKHVRNAVNEIASIVGDNGDKKSE